MTETEASYGLVFYLVDDYTEDHVTRVLLMIQHFRKKGRWPVSKPQFFDEIDDSHLTRPEDVPIRSVGGVVRLRSPGSALSRKADIEDLEATRRVVSELCEFSAALGVSFELQLGGRYVGRIEHGIADRLVSEVLIAEWERSLGLTSQKPEE